MYGHHGIETGVICEATSNPITYSESLWFAKTAGGRLATIEEVNEAIESQYDNLPLLQGAIWVAVTS